MPDAMGKSPKSVMNEYGQCYGKTIEFQDDASRSTSSNFVTIVRVDGQFVAEDSAPTKKMSHQRAALKALDVVLPGHYPQSLRSEFDTVYEEPSGRPVAHAGLGIMLAKQEPAIDSPNYDALRRFCAENSMNLGEAARKAMSNKFLVKLEVDGVEYSATADTSATAREQAAAKLLAALKSANAGDRGHVQRRYFSTPEGPRSSNASPFLRQTDLSSDRALQADATSAASSPLAGAAPPLTVEDYELLRRVQKEWKERKSSGLAATRADDLQARVVLLESAVDVLLRFAARQ